MAMTRQALKNITNTPTRSNGGSSKADIKIDECSINKENFYRLHYGEEQQQQTDSTACRYCKASVLGPSYSQMLKLLSIKCIRRVTMLDLKMAFLKLVNNMLVDRSSRLPNSYSTAKINQLHDDESNAYHLQAKAGCPVTPKKRRLDKQDTLEASVVEGSYSDPPSTPLSTTAGTPMSTSRHTSAVKQYRVTAGGSADDQMPRIENISLMGPADETSRSGLSGTSASKERANVPASSTATKSSTSHARHTAAMDKTGGLNTPRTAASLGSPVGVDPVDTRTLRSVIHTATTNAIRTLLKDREKLVNKQTCRSDDKIVNYRRMTSQHNAALGLDCKPDIGGASSERMYRDHVQGYHLSESSLWPLQPLSSQGVAETAASTHRAAPITVPLSSLSALQHKMNGWREKYIKDH